MADSPPNVRPSLAVTVMWIAFLSILIAAFWFVVLVYMPMQIRRFNEFGLQLPSLSKLAVDITMLLNDTWFVALPAMPVVVLGGVVILRHGVDAARGGILYALLMATLLMGAIGFFLFSVLIPLRKLMEGLSK